AQRFSESVIRGMSRVAAAHQAVNLAQGFPDFPADERIKRAAQEAIGRDINQYAVTWGAKRLRDAIVAKEKRFRGRELDPETQVTVCCGATEGMMAAFLAVIDPGDEAIIFQPFYENYGPDTILSGATPRYVTLYPPASDQEDWTFQEEELAAAFNDKTKVIVINTPHNPTGKIFRKKELEFIAALCQKWDVLAVTDEIYEHILYDGETHACLASLPGMADRTITVNGASKTFSVTGWRVGYVLAPEKLTTAIRKVHDFLTVGAAAPLQEAIASAMALPDDFYRHLADEYQGKRDYLLKGLREAGFPAFKTWGAYYLIAQIPEAGFGGDYEYAVHLAKTAGVATVPVSSFYLDRPSTGMIRFCFAKKVETLAKAVEKLKAYRGVKV
ncbi:MAG TPA: aminotransferase class I/II-fold pyridoxal phosphate-dependent enzyme, partial [bacterium]|nr:aminotransferase class I/II-fold pyridoxal phosphate-dependent enzyme [bacterium]